MAISRRQFVISSALAGAALAGGSALSGCSSTTQAASAELAYINGKIYTGNPNEPYVEAVAVTAGQFTAVGTTDDINALIGDDTFVYDLEDRLVLPGLVDGHNHIFGALLPAGDIVNLGETNSLEEMKPLIKDFAEKTKIEGDKVLQGRGWVNSFFENGCPTADILDELTGDKPTAIRSRDGHSYWVNTAMLERCEITDETPDPIGGTIERDKDGHAGGCFRDTAMGLIAEHIPDRSIEDYKGAILKSELVAASFGFTTYMNAMVNEYGRTNLHDAFLELDANDELLLRSRALYLINNNDQAEELVDDAYTWSQIEGSKHATIGIKLYMDGVVEGSTAALKEPYCTDEHNFGADRWSDDEDGTRLAAVVKKANEKGLFCHFHSMGDEAVDRGLTAIETAQDGKGDVNDIRNSMTHLQILDKDQFKRFADTGTIAVINPWGTKAPNFYEETEVVFLGEERASKEYPSKSFLDAGARIAAATDFPAGDPWNPYECMETYVNRTSGGDPKTQLNLDEALTIEQTVEAFTKGSAFELHLEDVCGTIEVGKSADLVVLDQNLFETEPINLGKVSAQHTLAMGNVVWDADLAEYLASLDEAEAIMLLNDILGY